MPYADPNCEAAIASRRRRARRTYYKLREKNIAKSARWNREHKEHVNALSVERRSKKLPPEVVLYRNAKNRAKVQNIPFNLTPTDLLVPEKCPVLGVPLVVATGYARDNSPSVDRLIPALGYVRGNVVVMSHKANTMKSNATLDELKMLIAFLEKT